MENRGRHKRSTGILDHDFLVALVREQIQQVLPEALRAFTAHSNGHGEGPKANTENSHVYASEAARVLGVSRARLNQYVRAGTIKVTKNGGPPLFAMTELREFVARDDRNRKSMKRSGTKKIEVKPELMPNREFARLHGVSMRTLYNWDKNGTLPPATRINGRLYRRLGDKPATDQSGD